MGVITGATPEEHFQLAGIPKGYMKSIVGILRAFAFQKFCSHLRALAASGAELAADI